MKNKYKYILTFFIILIILGFISIKFLYFNNSGVISNVSSVDIKNIDFTKTYSKFQYDSYEDSPKIPIKFKKFDGIYSLDSINLKKGDSINLKFGSNINDGKFNIVVINNSNNPIKIFKPNLNGKESFKINEDGNYEVKMIGIKASGNAFAYWEK